MPRWASFAGVAPLVLILVQCATSGTPHACTKVGFGCTRDRAAIENGEVGGRRVAHFLDARLREHSPDGLGVVVVRTTAIRLQKNLQKLSGAVPRTRTTVAKESPEVRAGVGRMGI